MSILSPCTLFDTGYVAGEASRTTAADAASYIRQAAAALIAIDNAVRLVDNYKKQRDIQDRMLTIEEEQHDHLKTVFWPRNAQFLAEFSTPEVLETVEVMGQRYAGRLVSSIAGAFAIKLREARCSAPRYCTSAVTKNLQDLLMARAAAMANARVLGRNIAFAEYQARNDTNVQRQMQAAALGRDMIQQAATLFAAAGEGLATAGGILSSQLGSAIQAFGYARNYRTGLQQQQERAPEGESNPNWRKQVYGVTSDFGFDSSSRQFKSTEAASSAFTSDPDKIRDITEALFTNQLDDSGNGKGPIGS